MDVSGSVGDFKIKVKHKPRYVVEKDCTGCGICIEKCPVQVVDTGFEAGIGYRKSIYTPFPQSVPKYPVPTRADCTYFTKGTCKACEKFCPTNAIDFTQTEQFVDLNVGNILIATGFAPFDARRIESFGYRRLPNVFTSMEFERMSNAAGPTGGRIVLRDGVTKPRAVAIVHCVGSRDKNTNEHCSAICCMQSLKFAHLVKEHTDADVYECYIDMRTPGKGYDEFYNRILNEGTQFIRGRVAEDSDALRYPEEEGHEGRLIVQVEDTLAGATRRLPVDMVILSVGLEPQPDAVEVARMFGIGCSSKGFIIERHAKLAPVATMTDGVFAAGAALGPRDIPTSVSNGGAAAAQYPEPHLPGPDLAGALPGHCGRGALLRLPHLQRPLPLQRHQLRRGRHGDAHRSQALPGLWRLRGGLPRSRHRRQWLQPRTDHRPDRRPAPGCLRDSQCHRPGSGGGDSMTAVTTTADQVTRPAVAPTAPRVPEPSGQPFEPLILGFTCNWCSYRAADLAGTGPHQVPVQRPARAPHVLGPHGTRVHPGGVRARRGRGHHDRLLA